MSELITTVPALRARLAPTREQGQRVGLVPTMGALHAGHLSLVAEAKRRAQVVVVTVFVNPTQFGPTEDFSRYPRQLEADVAAATAAGADVIFAPDASAMYPTGDQTRIRVPEVARHFEGEIRPHHFEGVATVCAKLFSVTGPCVAVFGRKDRQQLQLVRRMVRDLFLPVEIVPHPTTREADGLALSSRNVYLSERERSDARAIPLGLSAACRAFIAGERRTSELVRCARAPIEATATSVDYVACADEDGVAPLDGTAPDRVLLLVAARYGKTRLIDNVLLGEDEAPIPGG